MPWDFELDNIATQIESCRRDELAIALRSFFSSAVDRYRTENPATVKFHLVEMITCALHVARLRRVPAPDIQIARRKAYDILASTEDMDQLERELTGLLTELIDMIEVSDIATYSHNVRIAVTTITKNYSDSSLYIQSLAKSMGVNPSYLGRQFKKETGEFFNDYLTRIRISAAIQLLHITAHKASIIAGLVGFSDPHYFYSAFKKATGLSPQALRNSSNGLR